MKHHSSHGGRTTDRVGLPARDTALVTARYADELSPGERFSSASRRVRGSDAALFATVVGAAARNGGAAEGRFVHELLLLVMAVNLLDCASSRVLGLSSIRDVSFDAPVAVGDAVHIEGRVENVVPGGAREAVVTLAFSVVDADGRRLLTACADVSWATSQHAAVALANDDYPPGVFPF